MGHDLSKAPNIRGNYDFSANNLDGIFEAGFDQQLSIDDILRTLRFENATVYKRQNLLPNDSILINVILDSKIFTRRNNSSDIWHEILLPLFIGSPETRPQIQQLLVSFFQSLKDRSRFVYESERNTRAALLDKINDEKLAIINIHNQTKKAKFPNSEAMIPHLKTQQNIIRYISPFIEQRFDKTFCPHTTYFALSNLICSQLKSNPNEHFAYITLRWGISASELPPMIDGFVQLTKYSMAGLTNTKKLSLQILASNTSYFQLTNAIFIPSSSSLIGSSSLLTMDISVNPTSSSLFSDGKHLYILGKRGILIIVSLAKTAYKKRPRIQTIDLNIQNRDRSPLFLIGSNNNLFITNKNSSQTSIFGINPFRRISEPIVYQSDNIFGTPKIKPPFASDGHFIYCFDSPKRISVFSITNPPTIRFHKFIELQTSNAPLIVPYDRALVPKEWLTTAPATLFTNGIVISFLILRRSDQTNFSYFMRHFSLIDGSHISDIGFTLKWPVLSLSVDPWNECIWGLSPNNENVAILKMNLTCSSPPWFTGSYVFQPPSYAQMIQALSASDTFETAVTGFGSFLSFYSYNFFNLPFRSCISNPQYNINIAHTFAPCTIEALKSLINAIYYFGHMYLESPLTIAKQMKISLVSCIRLLEYNLMNFETRTNEEKTQVILLDSNSDILDCFLYLLNNPKFAFLNRLTCFTIVSCFSILFKNDQTRCAEIFSIIYKLMPEDFVFFMIQKLDNLPFFPYCFSAEICKHFFEPIIKSLDTATPDQIEMLLTFQRSLFNEMYSIYANTPIDIIENYKNRVIQETFFTFVSIMFNKILDSVQSLPSTYKEQTLENSPFLPILNSWIILFQPFSNFARASPKIATLIQPIFQLMIKKIKEYKLSSPINDNQTGFHLIYLIFFEIFSIYIESLASLLDGGSELSDTTRYSWLIRSTISSGITMEEINQILDVISNNSVESPLSQHKLKKGLSFSITKIHHQPIVTEIQEETFLLSILSSEPTSDVIELFNFLYQKVPNRFNRRLNDEDKHFERIVFVALVKQLGLYHEIVNLHENLNRQNSNKTEKLENSVEQIDNDAKHETDLVITHYMKQAMETVYRIRMILNVSKQQTKQLEIAQQDEVLPSSTESLNQNYPKYRKEVLRKCIFLLHIEPCLRFLSESFEQAFSDFLKQLQSFIISEIPLDQYFQLISKSENSKMNVSIGLELINDILSGESQFFCKYFLIEKLATSSNFLTFLSATSIDSFNNAAKLCIDKITTLLNLLISLMKPDQCLNVEVVLFLNLLLMIQHHGDEIIFQSLTTLITKIKNYQKSIDPHNFQSYLAFIATALYVLYDNNRELSKEPRFQSIVRSIISDGLKINELPLLRISLKMEIPTTITITDFINFYQKLEPADYYAATNILFDLILREQQPNEYFLWILNEISQICSGGHPHLMSSLPLITLCDPLKYTTVKTPGSLLVGAASLIHLCRMILTSPTNAKQQLYQIFEKILSKSKDQGIFSNPILLYGVFAVLSNSIEIIRVNSLVRNTGTNNIYFIDSFNKKGYLGWQLPITEKSGHSQILFDSPIEPISIIPFTSQMYPNVDILLPYFLKHLFNEQIQSADESLSFYVLSCLIEYYNDKSILIKLMKQLPEEARTNFIFGDSSKLFLNLLRMHLSIDSDGFCAKTAINPKTTFYQVSYITSNSNNYSSINNNCLISNAGINLFMSNILRLDKEVTVTFTIPSMTEFDAGLYMPSIQLNSTKILMIAGHEGSNEYIIGHEKKKMNFMPSKISITFSPVTQFGWITDEDNNEIMMRIKFHSPSVLFFVCLYHQSHIQFSFSDNDDHNIRKSISATPSVNTHLPILQVPKFSSITNEEVIQHKIIPSTSIVNYYTTGIEISLQTITISLTNPEPLKYAKVILPEKTYLGYSIPSNLLFQYSKNNSLTKIIKAKPAISTSKTEDTLLLMNSAQQIRLPTIMKKIKPTAIPHPNRPSLPTTRNNILLTPKLPRQLSANQQLLSARKSMHLIPLRSNSNIEMNETRHEEIQNSDDLMKIHDSHHDKKIVDVAVVDDSSGHVSRVNSDIFQSLDFLPPFHPSNLSTLPSALINHHVFELIRRIRKQTCNMIMINSFSNHELTISSLIKHTFNDVNSIHHFLFSILTYVEPISPSAICVGKSPIDFSFNILDPDAQFKSSLSSYHIAIQRILSYFNEHKKVDVFINTWKNLLISDFHNSFSHFISLDHEFAVVIPVSSETTSIHLTHNAANSWIIFYDGFGNTLKTLQQDAKVVFYINESNDEIELGNEIICINKKSVEGAITIKKLNNPRSIIAIPCFDNNESLFHTFFELIISFKYFVYYVKTKYDEISNDVMKSIRFTIYSLFCDGFTSRSPFFSTFGADFLQFLESKLPILTSDLNDSFIYYLSLLSVYTPPDEYKYIHSFIEEQQNLLDELYIFGTNNFLYDKPITNPVVDNYEETLMSETTSSFIVSNNPKLMVNNDFLTPNLNPSRTKIFDSPFPDSISNDDNLVKIMNNVKRVLIKRRDIHSCPFHLLFHRWAQYSHWFPPTHIDSINSSTIKMQFSFYTPKTFHFVFQTMPQTTRFCISFEPNFQNAKYLAPDVSIGTKGHSTLYISIADDPEVTFASLDFYVESEDPFSIEDFLKSYRNQFVLDGKTFFIHWDVKHDQTLLRCFSVKPYYRNSMSLNFNPIKLLYSHLNYSMNLLCCRIYFLMILNFYYTKSRNEFGKDPTLHSFLPSIMMKIKMSKFKKLYSRSNETEGDFIKVNRKAAFEVRDGQSNNLNLTLISQLSEVYTSPIRFRLAKDSPWKVQLIGEQGCDVGGLARELVTEAVIDLISPTCGLVVPVPNAVVGYGNCQHLVIPIPNPGQVNVLKQYKFAGALIGIAIRSGLTQEFNFPPLVWEYLMTRTFSIERVFEIDHNFQSLITGLKQAMRSVAPIPSHLTLSPNKKMHNESSFFDGQNKSDSENNMAPTPSFSHDSLSELSTTTESTEQWKTENDESSESSAAPNPSMMQINSQTASSIIDRFNLRFVVQTSTGSEVLLTQRGFDENVTLVNAETYISMACEFRLNEMKEYLEAMANGLWENLDMKPPKYLDWQTLEYAACGEKEVPLSTLKKIVSFFEVPDDQQQIFWDVVSHFTSEQRSLLLKFSTGRIRLPAQIKGNSFLTVDYVFGEVDKMPTASTCFNQLHLPRYSSFEKAYKLMSLAIEYTGTFEIG